MHQPVDTWHPEQIRARVLSLMAQHLALRHVPASHTRRAELHREIDHLLDDWWLLVGVVVRDT